MRLKRLDGSPAHLQPPGPIQSKLAKIGIEHGRPLEFRDCHFVLAHPNQSKAKRHMTCRQIGGQAHRLTGRLMGAVEGCRPGTIVVPPMGP